MPIQFGCETQMQYHRTPAGNADVPNVNDNYATFDRGTFDAVAASFEARTHYRHNSWIGWGLDGQVSLF